MLHALSQRLELLVCREVGRLIRCLTQRRERHTAVKRAEALLTHNRVQSVGGVLVARLLQRVRERVLLGLQTDFDHFHGVHDGHGLRGTSEQAGNEHALRARHACLAVGQSELVLFKTHEADGHLGHDAGHDRTETLVQAQRRFAAHNMHARGEEATGLFADAAAPAGQLHPHLDRVKGVTGACFSKTGDTASNEVSRGRHPGLVGFLFGAHVGEEKTNIGRKRSRRTAVVLAFFSAHHSGPRTAGRIVSGQITRAYGPPHMRGHCISSCIHGISAHVTGPDRIYLSQHALGGDLHLCHVL